jgi:hypothetical protein
MFRSWQPRMGLRRSDSALARERTTIGLSQPLRLSAHDRVSLPHRLLVVLADSRRFAEEWIYRFLAAALGDAAESNPQE